MRVSPATALVPLAFLLLPCSPLSASHPASLCRFHWVLYTSNNLSLSIHIYIYIYIIQLLLLLLLLLSSLLLLVVVLVILLVRLPRYPDTFVTLSGFVRANLPLPPPTLPPPLYLSFLRQCSRLVRIRVLHADGTAAHAGLLTPRRAATKGD